LAGPLQAGRRKPEAGRPAAATTPEPRAARTEALMVAHVVLFRPRPHLSQEARQRLVEAFTRAVDEIPLIRRARIGRRVTHGRAYEQLMRADYSHAAVLEFNDLEDLKGYLAHEAHEALGVAFFECFEDALIYDYDLDEATSQLTALFAAPG
jgi:hypothetical protein